MSRNAPPELTARVRVRAGGRCEYCHAPQVVSGQTFHVDHIRPLAAGGQTTPENLCLACAHCNIAKGHRTLATDPRTRRRGRLFNPRADTWDGHFRWSRDWSRVIGRTPIGRATVATLAMNATLMRRARPFWRVVGLIP